MTVGLIVAALLVVMVIAWRVSPKPTYTPDPDDPLDDGSTAPIDREELERAEREVRQWGAAARPDEERPEDDWGPGTGGRRPAPPPPPNDY
ncbi:MAG TPA: hypothetical protein VG712_03980 [Gemmatimonadales bacterium]|nr:hypothetical protein [Gemmatimonadales bacterium]HWA40744.1 hypothetical protein [Gemmatimonadales bacterium]